MIRGGYILQPRLFDKSDASHLSPVTRELWFYLLRNVNHSDNGQHKRGSGFFSLSDIQDALCWYTGYRKNTYSKPQLTKALRRLCERTMVETAKATRGLHITICNYVEYQNPKNYESNGEGSTKEPRRDLEGQTIDKNGKNEKNEKKDLNTGGENLSLPEIKKIYSETFRDLLPTKLVMDRLQWMIDNFDKDAITNRFEGAASAKAKSLNYITNGMVKELEDKEADEEMWANMGKSNES